MSWCVRIMNINKIREQLAELKSQYNYAKRQVNEETKNIETISSQIKDIEDAQKLTQQVAQTVQERVHNRIASIVTRCLETVFGDEAYTFQINFTRKRGRTEAELLFVRDGVELDSPIESSGGGPLDIASFALRLVGLVLCQPPKRRLLVLDEPMKFVSREYRHHVRSMLETISHEMDVQIVMVTHTPEFAIGKVIELE